MASVHPSGRPPSSRQPPPPYNSSSSRQSSQHQPPPPGSQQYPPGPPPGAPPYSSSSAPPPGTSSGYGHYSGGSGGHRERPAYGNYASGPPPPPPPPSSSYPSQAPPGRNPNSNSSWSNHHQQQHQHQSQAMKRETEEERRERKKREYEMKKQKIPGHHSQAPQKPRIEKKQAVLPEKAENRLKRPSTFLCKMKFRNELPDPVSQPKFLRIYNDKDRYSKYSITSMEKTYKHKLFVEPDLGIPLDLLDLSIYNNPSTTKTALDPADVDLLVDDDAGLKQKADIARRKERPTDKGVAWLVKTTYISPVSMDPAKQSLTEKQAKELRELKEGKQGFNFDRDHQIQAIEETFRVSKLEPVHQTKPELKPVEVLPLLPDFNSCGDQFVHVVFDTEPTGDSEHYCKFDRKSREYIESQAIIKSYSLPREDGKTEKFLAYVVPKMDEAQDDDDEIPYTWIREYHWDIRAEDARNNYIFCFGKDAVQYLPISSKLLLHKKKAREGRSKDEVDNQFLVPASVTVHRRDTTGEEEEQRESMKRIFMDGGQVAAAIDDDAPAIKRKRPSQNERHSHSSKRSRSSFVEETREASDEDVSI